MTQDVIEFNGELYRIDIKRVFDLIFYSDKNTRKEEEITDGYEMVKEDEDEPAKLKITSKMIREIKTPTDSQSDGIRYDFLKMLIGQVISLEDEIDLGSMICINTLIKERILVKIED